MAAGRHGGYRDYEAREREPDAEASRRTAEQHPGGRQRSDADRRRDGGSSRGGRDASNGYGHRRSHPPKSRLSGRLGDREPGEVLSGSASDDSGGRLHRAAENVVSSSGREGEVAAAQLTSKKRKFSPIIWDRDSPKPPLHSDTARGTESVSTDTANGKKVAEPAELPPPPPVIPQGHIPERVAVDKSPMDVDLAVDTESAEQSHEPEESKVLESEEAKVLEPEESKVLEEEEYPTMRNISTSRWAGANDDEQVGASLRKKKSTTPADFADLDRGKKTPSPELGEVVTSDISGGRTMSRSTDSGRMGNDEKEVDKDDYMDVDREEASDNDSVDRLSSGSENQVRRSETPEPVKPAHRCINMLHGCRSVDVFERLNKINEGTYGVVYRAKDKKTAEVVALKKVKMEKEREGFPLTSLREINILLSFHHPSIVDVKEVVVGSSLDSIFMVMEYMEHDLKGVMENMKQPYTQSEVKCLVLQLLEGVKYLHDNWVLHRDLKTSNLLLNNRGELKICDFGLSRQYGSPLKPYTQLVVTLWYRAPELLLGAKEYSTAIDMWSVGCIMAELLAKEPLFNGKTEFEQLDKIFRTLGTPNEKIWPGYAKLPGVKVNFVKQPYNRLREKFPAASFSGTRPNLSEAGFDLLNKLLTYDPEKRISADAALQHPWFHEVPLPKSKDFMPTFPALNELDRRTRRYLKSPDPLEEQRLKELQAKGNRGLFS
ncbi:cyclin-dependent kinase G-2-like isoform X1 [Lolium rigidum]|uniref:cyclin-dependent kinase G-2-like isoform X1 n=1 Tax=Lolium rigidum TaxID=89674 RepID=UPI001F5D045E|nr:cyclin-dependent kinase G-2-like isoform X1 [Lolium rigidum]